MQRRSSRGQKGAERKAKGLRAGAGGNRRGTRTHMQRRVSHQESVEVCATSLWEAKS
jgi:hypothetical protein